MTFISLKMLEKKHGMIGIVKSCNMTAMIHFFHSETLPPHALMDTDAVVL
jgi:hypothetical protein